MRSNHRATLSPAASVHPRVELGHLARHEYKVAVPEDQSHPPQEHVEPLVSLMRLEPNAWVAQLRGAHEFIERNAIGTEALLPFEGPDSVGEMTEPIVVLAAPAEYPTLADSAASYYLQSGYDLSREFEFGLDLILDGLDKRLR